MDIDDEIRQLRHRIDTLEQVLDRQQANGSAGMIAVVAKTTTNGTYPTSAGAVYMLQTLRCLSPLSEGAAVALTAVGGIFAATNLGSAIPPQGTTVLAVGTSDRMSYLYG